MPSVSGVRLYGKRVMMRPLTPSDFPQWSEVRVRNEQWLLPWEPLRSTRVADPTRSRDAFSSRCAARDRERQAGTAYGFALFVDNAFAGEAEGLGLRLAHGRAPLPHLHLPVALPGRAAGLSLRLLGVVVVTWHPRSAGLVDVLGLVPGTDLGGQGVQLAVDAMPLVVGVCPQIHLRWRCHVLAAMALAHQYLRCISECTGGRASRESRVDLSPRSGK